MVISSYQKSLWARNLLLILTAAALVAAAVKVGWSVKKIKLTDQAMAYYQAGNLVSAEQAFSLAGEYSVIAYGDAEWTAFMSGLTAIRTKLESLSQQALSAIGDKQEQQVLDTYRRYQSFKQEALRQQDKQAASFFQAISARLGMEKTWSDYYQQAIRQAKSQMQKHIDEKSFENESFIHTLALIPDEFFGGEKNKQDELDALFGRYETSKLRALAASRSFLDVINGAAKSIRHYREEGIAASWLQKQLERYAQGEISQSIEQQDLSGFVEMAKAYQDIEDALPDDSAVLAAIDRHLQSRIKQAEQYAAEHQFAKAIDLYQKIGGLLDTAELIAGVEERWTQSDPARLLQEKYPDKAFDAVFTGKDRWGTALYALGVDQKEHRLYFAANMPDSPDTVYIDHSLDIDTDFTVALSDLQDNRESPVILVQAEGKERKYTYLGLIPRLSRTAFETRFAIEADDFSVEDATRVIVNNAVGKGENEIASFRLDDEGLTYEEKLADLQPDAPPALDVHAGPGEDYEVIGQVSPDSSIQVVTDLNGWYQIQFDGKEGWIQIPKTAP